MRVLLATRSESLAALIRHALERFRYQWTFVSTSSEVIRYAGEANFDLIILDYSLGRQKAPDILRRLDRKRERQRAHMMVVTSAEHERITIEKAGFPRTDVVARPLAIREFVDRVQEILRQTTRVVCVGGGTGLFTLLSGLKTLPGISLASVVSMSDDGGSAGKLRDLFGVLPPGDVRRSLVALSTAPDLVNELMQFRFARGGSLKGHTIGNLLLTALSEMHGSMIHAVKALSEILNIHGEVIPVTGSINTLKAEMEDGSVISGEHRIDLFEGRDPGMRIVRLWQEPRVAPNPRVLEVLHEAHVIVLGPGDLYTSVIANLVVRGVSEAIVASGARKVYVCNVMTKPGETAHYTAGNHIHEVIRYLGRDCLDDVLCATNRFRPESLKAYSRKQQEPVCVESSSVLNRMTDARIHRGKFASDEELVRHDSFRLAEKLQSILLEQQSLRIFRKQRTKKAAPR